MEQKLKDKLWTKEFIIICIVSLIIYIGSFMRGTLTPLYMKSLSFDNSSAGLMTSIYAITALVFRPLMGRLVDTKGRKFMLLAGTFICALMYVLFGLFKYMPLAFQTIWILYAIQLVNGIGFSANSVSMSTMATDVIPNSRMKEGIGYYGLTNTLSQAIAPSIAIFSIGLVGYSNSFLAVASITLFACAVGFLINYEKKRIKEYNSVQQSAIPINIENEKAGFWDKIVEKRAFIPAVIMMLYMFAGATINTFLPIFATDNKIENIGLAFTMHAIGMTIPRLFIKKLIQFLGESRIMVVGYISEFIGCLLIFSAHGNLPKLLSSALPGISAAFLNLLPLLLAGLLAGFAKGMLQIMLNSAAIIKTPQHRRGAANATFYMFMDVGVGVGSAAWGFIADKIGIEWIYIGAAIFTIFGFIGSIPMRRQMRADRAKEIADVK